MNDRNSEFRTPVFICGNDNDLDGRVVVLEKLIKRIALFNITVILDLQK